ncbi:MAG: thiamine-phosphate kinase [Thermoplasmata archaeon]|nr:thiamine-phosphate kinase [Thermoplasmata archaeon]
MPKLSDAGEKAVIQHLISLFDPKSLQDIGDDCAILDSGDSFLLVTTDMITRATHMPENASPEDIGWYAAAVNLSDIAAMGGRPIGTLFAIGLPADTEEEWLDRLASGIHECCSRYGVPVIGGDTKENPSLTISGTAVGRVPKSQILRRSGARPGDILAMTGKLGRGIAWELSGDANAILRVEPRVHEGQLLAESGAVTSCIDMSDGLSASVHHLSKAGNVGFSVEADRLPLLDGLKASDREKAMHWGGDYELLFTVNPKKADSLFQSDLGCPVTGIGTVTEDKAIMLLKGDGKKHLPDRGYEHFRGARS